MTTPRKVETIVITGASAGIGEALARKLAGENPARRMVLTGRRADRLMALSDDLACATHVLALDMRDRKAVFEAFESLPAEFAEVDVLINNAGLALGLEPIYAADPDQLEQMIDTNVKGLVYATRALLPGMVTRKSGHIINLGSIAGTYPYPGGHVYGATKAFVEQFSLAMRSDLLGTRVRVTNIEPGMTETEFSLVRFGGDAAKAYEVYRGIDPLTAEDIAETIAWCLSRPPHVNINRVELMPTAQATGAFAVHRNTE
ncbi:MAG: SDR family oxidoreductase [Alphaproteobacteria bacterium]